MSLYRLAILLHVLSAFGFVVSHGISALTLFKIQREGGAENISTERICALLERSSASMKPAMFSLVLILLTGVLMTLMAGWWRYGWVWLSLALLIAVGAAMGRLGTVYMDQVRRAVGLAPRRGSVPNKADLLTSQPKPLAQVIASGQPRLLSAIGVGGLAAIIALMVLKPF